MRNSYILMALFSVLVLVNCRKEKIVQADCRRLQNATSTADKDEAESVINKFINSLASQTYSPQNLNNLVSAIGQQCGASATLLCFDCIQTLPSQSEIRISYPGISGPVEKTIDITYTASNKMIFHNLHD